MMRKVEFEGDALEVLREFPDNARQRAGFEIDRVQQGLEPMSWKPCPSIGAGVREIRVLVGLQYRIIYVAKFGNKVHVLHAFQKKTRKTASADINLAKKRLLEVTRRYGK